MPLHGSRFHELLTFGLVVRFTQKLNAGTKQKKCKTQHPPIRYKTSFGISTRYRRYMRGATPHYEPSENLISVAVACFWISNWLLSYDSRENSTQRPAMNESVEDSFRVLTSHRRHGNSLLDHPVLKPAIVVIEGGGGPF
jgi:hypothetical protein